MASVVRFLTTSIPSSVNTKSLSDQKVLGGSQDNGRGSQYLFVITRISGGEYYWCITLRRNLTHHPGLLKAEI